MLVAVGGQGRVPFWSGEKIEDYRGWHASAKHHRAAKSLAVLLDVAVL